MKHAEDEKSPGVAGKLVEFCITRFEKKYLRASIRDCCQKAYRGSLRLCLRACYSIYAICYKNGAYVCISHAKQ